MGIGMSNVPKLRFNTFTGEWSDLILREVVEFRNGKAHEKDISENGQFIVVNSKFISTDGEVKKYSDSQISPLFKNDIVMVMSDVPNGRALAKCFLIDKDGAYTLNQRICALRTRDGDTSFLLYRIDRNPYYLAFDSGVGQTNLKKDEVLDLPLKAPQLAEQRKIAAFLTAVDTKIEQLIRKEELLKQYKKGVTQKIFSQEIRFKADDGSEFPEWEESKVSELFAITRGNVLAVGDMSEVRDGSFIYPVYSSQTKRKGLTGYYSQYLFEDCLTWTTDGANAGDVNLRKGKFYCTNVCGVLKSELGFANECVAQILNSITKRYVSYVGNPKLMNNTMGGIKIRLPMNLAEQTKISNFLSSVDAKIDQISLQISQIKTFKKGLLQQMFV